ncbi:hypothetical protein ABR738_32680 [Streptomyces sp. Edi4]|uniref:hypothetical protein n=1 Tax=Streptomyces sp. Edi4 TaxID=3162527 RepID=UPI0033055FBA
MPSASLAALRRVLAVLLVLGALFGGAPGAEAAEGRTVAASTVLVTPDPSNESAPDAAEAVLPPQSIRAVRQIRPFRDPAVQETSPRTPLPASYDYARPSATATATGVRCVVLRC